MSGKDLVVFENWLGALFFEFPALKLRISSCDVANAVPPGSATTTTGYFQSTHVRQLNSCQIWRWGHRPFFQAYSCKFVRILGGPVRLSKILVLSMYTLVGWPDFCGWQELQVVPLASCFLQVPHLHKNIQIQQIQTFIEGKANVTELSSLNLSFSSHRGAWQWGSRWGEAGLVRRRGRRSPHFSSQRFDNPPLLNFNNDNPSVQCRLNC